MGICYLFIPITCNCINNNSIQYHCQEIESSCIHHCLKFGLSDPKNANLKETCAHELAAPCKQCDNITTCLDEIQQVIKGEDLKFYSKEQQDNP